MKWFLSVLVALVAVALVGCNNSSIEQLTGAVNNQTKAINGINNRLTAVEKRPAPAPAAAPAPTKRYVRVSQGSLTYHLEVNDETPIPTPAEQITAAAETLSQCQQAMDAARAALAPPADPAKENQLQTIADRLSALETGVGELKNKPTEDAKQVQERQQMLELLQEMKKHVERDAAVRRTSRAARNAAAQKRDEMMERILQMQQRLNDSSIIIRRRPWTNRPSSCGPAAYGP